MTDDVSFSELARRYCELIEERHTMPLAELLNSIHSQIARLYATALALPEGERSDVEVAPMDDMWAPVYHDLQQRLGQLDLYTEIYHPYADDEPVTGSVADAMADVYVDLKAGLVLHDAGHMSDAVWEWRTRFEINLGHHALDVLRALHAHRFMSERDDTELAVAEPAD